MKFSLRTLIAATTLAGLACAALAKPSGDWLTVVISLTAVAFAIQILRALLQVGAARAAAMGWLLFATVYLALVLAPWTRNHVGPSLLSSQALKSAQTRWFPEPGSAEMVLSFVNDAYFAANTSRQVTLSTSNSTSYSLVQSLLAPSSAQPSLAAYFQLSGHWLCAWLAGWLGAVVATAMQRRAERAQARPAASAGA